MKTMSIAGRRAALRRGVGRHHRRSFGWFAVATIATAIGCAHEGGIVTLAPSETALTVRKPALFPETIEYDRARDRFLLGSFREGAVYQVDDEGRATPLIDDPRLCSVLGIAVDANRSRLWAVNADLGACVRPSTAGPKNLAAVGMYDLTSGRAIQYIDVAPLSPGAHLLNGIALDEAGNAYVTDSFSPVIYRVDARGGASLFLRDAAFGGDGINLNGLAVHPDGYLLVIKKSDGALFKVPLANPAAFSRVRVAQAFPGGDGVTLVGPKELVIIANQVPGVAANAAYSLASNDGWATAEIRAVQMLGPVYPTTAVVRKGTIYVVHSRLNELLQASPDRKGELQTEATIRPIGTLQWPGQSR